MNNHGSYIKLLSFSFLLIFSACNLSELKNRSDENKLADALEKTSANKSELLKVIYHYSKNEQDSLKLKAAKFLISNMPGKGYYSYVPKDDKGRIINHDFFPVTLNGEGIDISFFNFQSASKTNVRFELNSFVSDCSVITSSDLIENIDYAFKAWNLPWARKLSFNQFKEFILPYRVRQEPLSISRKQLFEENLRNIDTSNKSLTVIDIAGIVNNKMKNKYKYIHNELKFYPGRLTMRQIENIMGGRCDDLNAFVGSTLRSLGVPVCIEFTPN